MTPEDENLLREFTLRNERCLEALDSDTCAFLRRASISPREINDKGDVVFERSPAVQGDHGSCQFTVAPQLFQSGYTALSIADALFYAGWAQGAEQVRRDLRRGLGLE